MTTTITIDNRDDLRPGDYATFSYEGQEASGIIWKDEGRALWFFGAAVRYADGGWEDAYAFVTATRAAPDLPTEPGSVIQVKQVRGKEREWATALYFPRGSWVTSAPFGGEHWHRTEHIEVWRPVTVKAVED